MRQRIKEFFNKQSLNNTWKELIRMLRFTERMQLEDNNFTSNKEEQSFWKNKIFFLISDGMVVMGAPLMFYGAYLFYRYGELLFAVTEIILYLITVFVLTRKSIPMTSKKYYIVYSMYTISILLLLSTGYLGSGLICVVFSMILSGCLLEQKQIKRVVLINIAVFAILTILLLTGALDGTYMAGYKDVWFINAGMAQGCGIILLLLINAIYQGLENQTKQIKKSREIIAASEKKQKAMIANISDIIMILDKDGNITYQSPNLQKLFWGLAEEAIGTPFSDMLHPEEQYYMKELLLELQQENGLQRMIETRYIDKNGKTRYLELTAVNLSEDMNIQGLLINFSDITERKIRDQEILHLSFHDSLTGLYNRAFYENELKRLDQSVNLPLSVIVGDINGLKMINDSLGHSEGDKILVAMGKILMQCCRNGDMIARTGGDEFVIIMPKTYADTADKIIRKITLSCEEYNKKITGDLYHLSISLGAATKILVKEKLDELIKTAEEHMYKRKLLEGRSYHSSILNSMKTALLVKSHETEEHARRLIDLSKAIGMAIGLTGQQFDELELFATLHDIGKIGVSDQILNKPGGLTEEEWVKMRKHSEIGYRIAMSSPELMSIGYYILTHHERWDGTGYPQGLSGENIPLLSRILAVADAYDAMTEDRPYRKAMPKDDAVMEIIRNAGTQFDPNITRTFINIITKDDGVRLL